MENAKTLLGRKEMKCISQGKVIVNIKDIQKHRIPHKLARQQKSFFFFPILLDVSRMLTK